MKKQTRTFLIVLLNVLFCAYLLWFSANNSYLRPYAGSKTRELLAGLILLATFYLIETGHKKLQEFSLVDKHNYYSFIVALFSSSA